LAEALGCSVSAINAMTEKELTLWMVRGPLWPRRLELMLMQMTSTMAQLQGNKTRMADFDLFAKDRTTEADTAAHEVGLLAGVGVRKLGQGRAR